jgi:hypothetical protein
MEITKPVASVEYVVEGVIDLQTQSASQYFKRVDFCGSSHRFPLSTHACIQHHFRLISVMDLPTSFSAVHAKLDLGSLFPSRWR